ISPHFAFYSQLLIPDSISVLPILLAIYLIIRASKRPRLITVIKAAMLLGISCWLRPNALLLAPFLVLIFPIIFEPGKRLRYSIAFIIVSLLIISPITIRNLILF